MAPRTPSAARALGAPSASLAELLVLAALVAVWFSSNAGCAQSAAAALHARDRRPLLEHPP